MKYSLTFCGWALSIALAVVACTAFHTVAAQAPGNSGSAANSLNVLSDTSFLATLTTPIAISLVKKGDPVEAEMTQDLKQGHEVLVKKSSILLGHVESTELLESNAQQAVAIAFDRVKPKKGDEMPLHLVIQALAPRSDVQNDSVDYATGRGIQGATQQALPAGHASATQGTINPLTTKSHGVQDLAGLELRERIVDNRHFTVLAASRKDIQLKKGTQLVMRVTAQ